MLAKVVLTLLATSLRLWVRLSYLVSTVLKSIGGQGIPDDFLLSFGLLARLGPLGVDPHALAHLTLLGTLPCRRVPPLLVLLQLLRQYSIASATPSKQPTTSRAYSNFCPLPILKSDKQTTRSAMIARELPNLLWILLQA